MKQVKGWRRFDRGRLDAICADLAAASLTKANIKGTLPPTDPQEARGTEERENSAIDPMSGKN
jgi:hypothetical protein